MPTLTQPGPLAPPPTEIDCTGLDTIKATLEARARTRGYAIKVDTSGPNSLLDLYLTLLIGQSW